MRVVILSGGSGSRLWPLSNSVRSKQFLKLFARSDGSYESMLMRTHRYIGEMLPNTPITITTSQEQMAETRHQLGDCDICLEPCRRDTFPAVCLVAAYLHDVMGVSGNETLIICSSDGNVDPEFFSLFKQMDAAIIEGASLTCVGVEPTYPSEKYGYIIPKAADSVAQVERFVEKPNVKLASQLIEAGALWNAGVYGMRISYALDKAQELLGTSNYEQIVANYSAYNKISFDYAVSEHERNLHVVRYDKHWVDLGTWATLADSLANQSLGSVVLDNESTNTLAINELNVPMLVLGMPNAVICATPDGILVSNRSASSKMKPYADTIAQAPRQSEKSWGSYRVLHVDAESLTILVTLRANNHMNYHAHKRRSETWTIVAGEGRAVIDGEVIALKAGDSVALKQGCVHTLIADTELKAIEVQIGKDIHVDDKQLFDWDFSFE